LFEFHVAVRDELIKIVVDQAWRDIDTIVDAMNIEGAVHFWVTATSRPSSPTGKRSAAWAELAAGLEQVQLPSGYHSRDY
jgi:hypothetical protein